MKNGTKVYQKIKTLKTSLSKNKFNNRNYITTNSKQYNYYEEEYPESFIKSKSLSKIKIKKGSNKKDIKLPSLKNNIFVEKNNTRLMKKFLIKNNSNKKMKIKTNNINNYHSNNQSINKLLSKHSKSTYNLKMNQNYNKTKKINLTTRHNKNNLLSHENDQAEWNENSSDKNNLNESKKLDVLYEIEKKVAKIQNCFRKHLKEEETVETTNTNHQNDVINNNVKNDNLFEIISDISLSEEELNFSEEDSLEKKEFSLDDEDL